MITAPQWNPTDHPRALDSGEFVDRMFTPSDVSLDGDEVTPEPWRPTFHMPANQLTNAEDRIARANAKLAKLGIDDRFTYEVERSTKAKDGIQYEFVTITLNRPQISFGGWTFTGAHDFTPGGGVLNFRTTADAPEVIDNHCDHCGSKRSRTRVYTVVHPEKGTMQVGQSCLEAFLGMSPTGLWALTSELELNDIEETTDGIYDARSRVYAPEDMLIAALTASNDGKDYLSASRATFTETPTSVLVGQNFTQLLADGDTKERALLARRIIRWARKIEAPRGSYLDNIHQLYVGRKEDVWIRSKDLGLAVSTVAAYQNELDAEARKKVKAEQKDAEKREYLAPVKSRVEGIKAKVLVAYADSDFYGGVEKPTTWFKMLTDTGHIISWKSSRSWDVHPGDEVEIEKATVKDQKVDKYGSFQTVLTRATMSKL